MRPLAPAFALALLVLPLAMPVSQADVLLGRVVAGVTVYENGEFVFPDALIVPEGATLVFRNATIWLDADRLCTGYTNIPAAYQCVPQLGIRGGTLIMDRVVVDTHRWNGELEGGYIIDVEHGDAQITDSDLKHYRQISLYKPGLSPSLLEGNWFHESPGPIRFLQGVEATFRNNLVTDTRDGVWVNDATVDIVGNTFRDITQEFGTGGARESIWVFASSPQDRVWPTLGEIRGNRIENAFRAILNQNAFAIPIEDNVITNVTYGMTINIQSDGQNFARQPPIVRNNIVHDATNGIVVAGTAAVGSQGVAQKTLDLRGNAILDARCHALRVLPLPNVISVSVDARDTWWGSRDGPTSLDPACAPVRVDDESASVDTSPWLTKEPKWVKRALKAI